jgi:UDP-N-acetylglucosamine 4-epimerase
MFNIHLYNSPYHTSDLSQYKFLVTGGAGFIGSNLVEYLLRYNAGHVRVLDNLSNGYFDNIKDFIQFPNFDFIEGDIRDFDTCKKAMLGIDYVSHQAALGSVPRSINDPITSNAVNIAGFLNMLVAAKESPSCRRFVYAASSSTYGDSLELPKVEGREGKPLSPYAVTKAVNEYYGDVFSKIYGFHSIGLRYFNVFGPKQNPNNPYAAVIPIFCKHFIDGTLPTINGDGLTSRDFTFVENAVQANIKAMLAYVASNYEDHDVNTRLLQRHEVYNVACGDQITLTDIINALNEITGQKIQAHFKEQRAGDVRHSKASIEKIKNSLHYDPKIKFRDGLQLAYDWYLSMSA